MTKNLFIKYDYSGYGEKNLQRYHILDDETCGSIKSDPTAHCIRFWSFFWNRNVYSYQMELPSQFEGNEKNMIFRMMTHADQSRVIKNVMDAFLEVFFDIMSFLLIKHYI